MQPHRCRWRSLAATALFVVAWPGHAVRAQDFEVARGQASERASIVGGGHFTLLGANVLASGVTAGLLRWYGGGSFLEGFAGGAAGGVASYAGKTLAVRNGTAAPLLGRQLAAAGASAVRNAGAGRALLSELSLPVGPFHLNLAPGRERPAWVSVDLLAVGALTALALHYDVSVDWGASLATAAPVLRVDGVVDADAGARWIGRHLAGTVLIRDEWWEHQAGGGRQRTLAHERVHLLQYDQLSLLWSDPIERALLDRWAVTRRLEPYVDLGLAGVAIAGFNQLDPRDNPIEIEASYLAWLHMPVEDPGSWTIRF